MEHDQDYPATCCHYLKERYGEMAIDQAALHNHVNIMDHLMDQGAVVTGSAFFYAAAGNSVDAMKWLDNLGHDHIGPCARNDNGETPMHWAAANNAVEALDRLKEQGAEIYAKDNNGKMPMEHARENNAQDALHRLMSFENHDGSEQDGALHVPFIARGKDLETCDQVMVAITLMITRTFAEHVNMKLDLPDFDTLARRVLENPTDEETWEIREYVKKHVDPNDVMWNGASVEDVYRRVYRPPVSSVCHADQVGGISGRHYGNTPDDTPVP